MSIFEAYDSEYNALTRDISKKIQELKNNSDEKSSSSSLMKHIEALFNQGLNEWTTAHDKIFVIIFIPGILLFNKSMMLFFDVKMNVAQDLIKQMEIEVRSHDSGTRKALGERLIEYKRALSSLRCEFSFINTCKHVKSIIQSFSKHIGLITNEQKRFLNDRVW